MTNNPLLMASHEVIDGQFVSVSVRRVVDAIREYEPEIQVHWVPPAARKEGQAAYRIVHFPVGREPYIMFTVRRDEDMNMSVLQKIIQNDQRNGKTSLSEIEAWEEAQKRIEKQKFLDDIEEANDIAAHVFRSRLNKYKVNDEVTIYDRGGQM